MAITGPYRVPNIQSDSISVYTNKPIAGAFRGFGVPQLSWAMDSAMDILAEGIGMDPVEFRLKNALEEGDISATGQVLHSVGIKECIRKAADAIEWSQKPKKYRGKGIGTTRPWPGWWLARLPPLRPPGSADQAKLRAPRGAADEARRAALSLRPPPA